MCWWLGAIAFEMSGCNTISLSNRIKLLFCLQHNISARELGRSVRLSAFCFSIVGLFRVLSWPLHNSCMILCLVILVFFDTVSLILKTAIGTLSR